MLAAGECYWPISLVAVNAKKPAFTAQKQRQARHFNCFVPTKIAARLVPAAR
jgi:hypothetical protein